MGMSICKFYLTDLQTFESTDFDPLWVIGIGMTGFSWNEDQNKFSLQLVNPQKGLSTTTNFFIYNIETRQFSSIHFTNWNLLGRCHNDHLEIEYNESIEREHLKYPTKDLTKPSNIYFNFSDQLWTDIKYLDQFNNLNKDAMLNEFEPIDNGWRPFKGQLPQTTEVLIWELEKFAEYGDSQSIEWFDEIQEKTNDIDWWVNASHYLGLKIRK